MAFNNKNPPWQRNAGMQALSMGFPQAQPVFNQNIGLQQQQNLSLIPQMGQIYSQTVQYPTSRPINTIAFQNQPQAQSTAQMGGQNASKFNPNQRVFSGTGHVTKVQNDFGFIDEEVFFHKNVCKGAFPKVGDRVLVEAAYNQNMPFKWNATRVQVLQSAASSSGVSSTSSSRHTMGGGGYNSSQQLSSGDRTGRNRYSPTRKSPDRHGHRSSNHDSRQRDIDDDDRRRRRDDRDGDRYRDKHRDRTPDRRERERSPVRKLSPKRRKTRPIPRYMVQMPKQLLTQTRVDILELRRRYLTLYIPSDFFTSEVCWIEAFPPNEPFSIKNPCAFHVMHKEVEPLVPLSVNDLEPVDADYLYSAKVMLIATPPMAEFYQKCFATAEDRDRYEDLVHPTRLISFLVGIRGKSETMAIGGPWSPSLDGENPQSDPNVLIKTAIRTCKGLTGIDLSNCTRWYRFVELYYRRSETYNRAGRLIPARIETVVIFLPDIRSCQPTRPEWDELHLSYKSHLERIINSQSSDSPVPPAAAAASTATPLTADSSSPTAAAVEAAGESADKLIDSATSSTSDSVKTPPAAEPEASIMKTPIVEVTDTAKATAVSKDAEDDKADVVEITEKEEPEVVILDDDDEEEEESKKQPTHYMELDVKKLKVTELRTELQARDLPTDGVKNVLITRLTKALEQEQEEDVNKEASETVISVVKSDAKATSDEELPTEEKKIAEENAAEKDSEASEEVSVKPVEKEAEEDFETMDNVDMSEVTVIDEYDSKAEEKTKPEKVQLTEKERQLLEKRYSLPEQPHIIVHPSRTAKSGKFDCAVMSLSVLLDYRSEDSKEHSFEVSLFAELFNEMLTRDFGFNIYKALHMLPTRKDEEKKEKEVTIDLDDVDDKKINGDGAKDKSGEEDTTKCNNDKDEKDKSKERDNRKRTRFDDPTEDDRRRREKEKDRVKFYTFDRELLLSFTYFDVSHCGYIFDKDIEDLFYTIGLQLSRSQIRRLVSKAVTRDSLYYRKLTDKVKEDDDVVEITDDNPSSEKDEKDDEKKAPTETDADDKKEVDTVEIPETDLKEMATGNCNYKEQLKASLHSVTLSNTDANEVDKPPAKKIKLDPTVTEDGVLETESGFVVHNGGVVNVSKLLEQMRRLEKSHEEAELLLVDLRKHNAELTRNNSRANEKIKEQTVDIKNTTKKLTDTEQNLREITRKYNEYYSTVSNIYDRVSLVLNRTPTPSNRTELKRSSSITSSKRGSSRDHSSRKDIKLKDKEADSEKTKENSGADTASKSIEKKSDDSSDVELVVAGSDSKESVETMDVDASTGVHSDETAKVADQKEEAPEEAKDMGKKE